MSKKRKLRKLKSLHVSDLYRLIKSGDDDALEHLIDRQQEGECLRYYPEGRDGPEDFGIIPVYIDSRDGCVVIRFGRPFASMSIDKETCFAWILGIPRCMSQCAADLINEGIESDDVREEMDRRSNPHLDFVALEPQDEDGEIALSMFPIGEKTWKLGFQDSADLLAELCYICKEMNWTYEDEADDEDLETIAAIIKASR